MRTLSERILAKFFNNPLGRWYLGVPKGKTIYKITKSSAHYYTGEFSKQNGLPIICTGNVSPNGRNPFIHWLETWKPIHLCWLFIRMGWQIPKYFIGVDTGAKAPASSETGSSSSAWTNPTNAYANDGIYATGTHGFGQAEKTERYYGFTFGVTAGSTINGIEVLVEGHYTQNGGRVGGLQVNIFVGTSDDGTLGTNPQALNETTDTVLTFGGATTLPSVSTPTVTQINDDTSSGVKVELRTKNISGSGENTYTDFVDYLTVKVYYTEVSNLANLKSLNTNLKANIKSINTNTLSNVKSLDTIT